MSEETTESTETTDTTTSESLLDGNVTLGEGEYFLSDGVKGTGEIPDWYNSDKFKSVAEQAKGHSELHKAFGGFTGSPKDGYTLPEGIEKDDALATEYTELAKELNMSQDGFDKGFKLLAAQAGVNDELTREQEMEKLGDNANERIQNVTNALKFKMGDSYDSIKDMVTDADSVMLAEALIKGFAPTKLPIDGGVHPEGLKWADIEAEMVRKDANGRSLRSTDADHNAKVERMIKEFAGDKTSHVAVG